MYRLMVVPERMTVVVCPVPDCRKCTLPRCNVKTDHPGGYCCAEHCQEHRSHGRSK